MLRADARLPGAAPAVEVIGIKFNDFGTCVREVLSNFETVSAQRDKFWPRRCVAALPNSGTCWFLGGRHDFYGEVNHEQEAGDDPAKLKPEQGICKSFPNARMQLAPPSQGWNKTSGDDQAFISAHVAEDDQERHLEALELILGIAQPESACGCRFRAVYKTPFPRE